MFRFAGKTAIAGWLLAALSIPVHGVQAGAIYKCESNGETNFQDRPCDPSATASTIRQASSKSSITVNATPVDGLSLAQLSKELMAVSASQREYSKRQRDLSERIRKLRNQGKRDAADAELNRWHSENDAIYMAMQQRSDGLRAEIRKRCPGGASLSPSSGRYDCRQK